jgi:pilus assembly protein CpaB
VSAAPRRRRALVLLALAIACGGLAASQVRHKVGEVESRVGPGVPVVVAARDLPPDTRLAPRLLTVREVPERFVPPDALASVGEAAGLTTAVPVSAGGYLTAGALGGGRHAGGGGGGLRPGERAIELAVAGGEALGGVGPGSRVDVLVSTEAHEGAGRTFLALEGVELLGLHPGAGGGDQSGGSGQGAASAADATATLRVSVRQAVYLTAAQSFAREVRLLPRPPGDGGRTGRAAVSAGGL